MTSELLPHHAELIRKSAISEAVATARGYRTVTIKAELRRLGFSDSQARVPALLLPIWGIDGQIANYQVRPDEPRIIRNKAVKYEIPARSRMVLDVPPPCRPDLLDPLVPLFITEGIRKADAAASVGLCCIALLGVWTWRGTNDQGGKVTLSAFESMALNSRDVYIVFDSDAWTKPSVGAALRRLRDFLAGRGAHVRIIRLPAGPGGVKTGLDDYLADGHTMDDLLGLATDQVPAEPSDEQTELAYRSDAGGLIHLRHGSDGATEVRLTNFDARIVFDIVEDDGVEQQRLFELETTLGHRSRTIRVPVRMFSSMSWPTEFLGAQAVVFPRNADHARVAIQLLSENPPLRAIFTSTGWREIDGQEVYLHAGGAVGPNGPVPDVEVRLDEPLNRFILPAPPDAGALQRAVRASLDLLDLAPDRITVPLLAATYRAPLGEGDLSVHATGPTGVFKTEVAALAQAHYGAGLDARHLPGSWSSTANSNEDLLFRAKDALIVIDDFAPGGSHHDIGRANREADRVLRAQGNRLGRQRMRADGSLRAPRPPRGLTLSTGEDVPRGASLVARMVVLEVGPTDIDVDRLTRCQADAATGLYAAAMSGFVCWLAQRGASGRRDLRSSADAVLDGLTRNGQHHRRTPRNLTSLASGLNALFTFAEESGVIETVEREQLWSRALAAFLAVGGTQDANQASENPVHRFIELLRSAIASGRAHIAGPDGDRPANPEAWGWRRDEDRIEPSGAAWRALGPRVGWVDGEDLYLLPDASYAAAQAIGRDVGDTISLQSKTLHKRLHEAGLLLSTERGRERLTIRRTLGGSRATVLHLSSALLREPSQPDQPDQHTDAHAHDGPVAWAGSRDEESANDPDERSEPAQAEAGGSTDGTVGLVGPVPSGEDGIVGEMQRLLDAGALANHPPVKLRPGEVVGNVEQLVRVELSAARMHGHVGEVARARLAAVLALVTVA